mmetsp:Transcript_2091/g.2652  ORF Transcript_2091/g.2652 Transcript_2091/m.2652 type:complete len:221 (+) Transcript_2091:1669-2331(+)
MLKPGISSPEKKLLSKEETEKDLVDIYKNLNKIQRPSSSILKQLSEELSGATESEIMPNYSNSSTMKSKLKQTIDNIKTKPRQIFPISGFRESQKSGSKSISNIFGDSSNCINPEDNKGDVGMIADQMNSCRKSDSNNGSSLRISKLDQSLKNSSKMLKQSSKNINEDADNKEPGSATIMKSITQSTKDRAAGQMIFKSNTDTNALNLHILHKPKRKEEN